MNISKNEKMENEIIEKLKTIQDGELPINIYDLGLIYKIEIEKIEKKTLANIEMTIINSRCTSTKSFTDLIKEKVLEVNEINECNIKFVFSPKWEVTNITSEGLKMLRKSQSL